MAIKYNYNSTLDQTYAEANQSPSQGAYMLMNRNVEVQRTNNFEFVMVNNFGSTNDYKEDYADVIRLSVSKSSVPHFSQGVLTVKRGNTSIKFAGVPEFDDGQLTCIDYIGMNTLEALRAWQSKSYNIDTEKVGLVTDYKRNCQLYEYTPDGQAVRKFEMYGCWIRNINEGDFEHDSNGVHQITVTICYDKAKEVPVDSITTINA